MSSCNIMTFKEFINESIDCSKLKKLFNFKGTLEANEYGFSVLYKLLNTNCKELSDLYCCLWDDLVNGFCKMNSSSMSLGDRKAICKQFKNMVEIIKIELIDIKECGTPNCDRKYMLRGTKHE